MIIKSKVKKQMRTTLIIYIIDEISVQVEIPSTPSNELIPGSVSCEILLINDIGKS